jgi:hypothetical protein
MTNEKRNPAAVFIFRFRSLFFITFGDGTAMGGDRHITQMKKPAWFNSG